MSIKNERDGQFRMWADAVDAVSRSNSFTDDQVINTWPDDIKGHYPELTVGAVRYADHCVKNHERLAELLDKALGRMLVRIDDFSDEDQLVYGMGRTLLAQIKAGERKGV